jgi:hypothetical protein
LEFRARFNFGIVYHDVQGEARLAPVYDLVTTSAYLQPAYKVILLPGIISDKPEVFIGASRRKGKNQLDR